MFHVEIQCEAAWQVQHVLLKLISSAPEDSTKIGPIPMDDFLRLVFVTLYILYSSPIFRRAQISFVNT